MAAVVAAMESENERLRDNVQRLTNDQIARATERNAFIGLKPGDSAFDVEDWQENRFPKRTPREDGWYLPPDDTSGGRFYGPEWREEQQRRQAALESDPQYQFLMVLAGIMGVDVERLYRRKPRPFVPTKPRAKPAGKRKRVPQPKAEPKADGEPSVPELETATELAESLDREIRLCREARRAAIADAYVRSPVVDEATMQKVSRELRDEAADLGIEIASGCAALANRIMRTWMKTGCPETYAEYLASSERGDMDNAAAVKRRYLRSAVLREGGVECAEAARVRFASVLAEASSLVARCDGASPPPTDLAEVSARLRRIGADEPDDDDEEGPAYRDRRDWAERPQNTGIVEPSLEVMTAYNEAYIMMTQFTDYGKRVGAEFLISDPVIKQDFIALVAIKLADNVNVFPKQYRQMDLVRHAKYKEINLMRRLKNAYVIKPGPVAALRPPKRRWDALLW